ncbi:MAG TPA: globin domain-containing protein [Thermoguttaceae bacterium]|nr:globin domain-containing protein [Thermoguttaceae bacterium]
MGLKTDLLEQSFAAMARRGDELVDIFYGNLFKDCPEVEPLFAHLDMARQKRMLLASLQLIVGNLRCPAILEPMLRRLGARHVQYGAREEHYAAVGAALLGALAEVAGEDWSDELAEAWGEAYEEISRHMLAGAPAAQRFFQSTSASDAKARCRAWVPSRP